MMNVLMMRSQSSLPAALVSSIVFVFLLTCSAAQAATDDRAYLLGDEGDEHGAAGLTLGAGPGNVAPGSTLDSQGPPGNSAFLDIDVFGSPTYASVSDRPGASAGNLGAAFDGPGSGDFLQTPVSLNAPTTMWDDETFFPPGSEFGLNYEGILAHGIQAWVKPNGATQNVRQDIVIDTLEHGIYITPANRWGLVYNDFNIEGSEPVTFGAWAHVMELAGFNDPDDGRSNVGGALLVNGVAVATSLAASGDVTANTYSAGTTSSLSIGANQDGSANLFHGTLDDVRLFFWGNNSLQTNGGAGPNGQDWGDLDLAEDNEWIANQLSTLGVTDLADVNLDGTVNNSDVTAFVPDFGKVRAVNGMQIGDWLSRQDGDLNYDGATDLADAFILHDGLVAAGFAAGLDFGLLSGTQVPEPATAALLVLGLFGLGAGRRAGRPCDA